MPKIAIRNPDLQKPTPERRLPTLVLGIADAGASPCGSTYHKRLRSCPREHALATIVGWQPDRESEALTVGYLIHYGLEVYYRHWMNHPKLPPQEREAETFAALAPIANESGYEETWTVVERVLNAYFNHYRLEDKFRILAVEETLIYHKPASYSARLDLVVEDLAEGGSWIVEHKSTRAITEVLLDGYQLDLQILGQVWLFERCVDLKQLPPFKGVVVNIMNKAVAPKFARTRVCPSQYHLRAFEDQLRGWKKMLPILENLGWPQDFSKCAGAPRGFQRCQFFELCHAFPNHGVSDWQAQDPPPGFIGRLDETEVIEDE